MGYYVVRRGSRSGPYTKKRAKEIVTGLKAIGRKAKIRKTNKKNKYGKLYR